MDSIIDMQENTCIMQARTEPKNWILTRYLFASLTYLNVRYNILRKNEMTKFPAYSELYIKDAQENIAWAFEYGVLGLGISLAEFVQKWISFKYIHLIENGNPHFVSGMSGIELSWLVAGLENQEVVDIGFSPSENYWTGFVASMYQWSRNVTYKEIFSNVTANDFLCMYPTFHEEDIANVLEEIDRRLGKA